MRAMAGGILVYVWGKEEFQAKLLHLSREEDAFVCRGLVESAFYVVHAEFPASSLWRLPCPRQP